MPRLISASTVTFLAVFTLGATSAGPASRAVSAAEGAEADCPVPDGGVTAVALPTLQQPREAPHELLALIEIPAGSAVKYELHAASGRMEVDRFLAMSMVYPLNYGTFPCTLAEDGDPLDVLVLTRFPVAPGSLIRVRPVGVLRMLDRGEEDHKILAVPLSSVDATYDDIHSPGDLPAAELDRIHAFFAFYKELPAPGAPVAVGPWEGPDAAVGLIRAALDAMPR